MTAARTPISEAEMPRPNRATASGSPAATIEPKAMSSTIAAPQQAEALGTAPALRHPDRAAAERDGQPVAAGALGEVDELRARRIGHVPHATVELQRGRGDRAVGSDADRARRPDALQTLGVGQEALNAGPRLRRLRPIRRLPNDADRVARFDRGSAARARSKPARTPSPWWRSRPWKVPFSSGLRARAAASAATQARTTRPRWRCTKAPRRPSRPWSALLREL